MALVSRVHADVRHHGRPHDGRTLRQAAARSLGVRALVLRRLAYATRLSRRGMRQAKGCGAPFALSGRSVAPTHFLEAPAAFDASAVFGPTLLRGALGAVARAWGGRAWGVAVSGAHFWQGEAHRGWRTRAILGLSMH